MFTKWRKQSEGAQRCLKNGLLEDIYARSKPKTNIFNIPGALHYKVKIIKDEDPPKGIVYSRDHRPLNFVTASNYVGSGYDYSL